LVASRALVSSSTIPEFIPDTAETTFYPLSDIPTAKASFTLIKDEENAL